VGGSRVRGGGVRGPLEATVVPEVGIEPTRAWKLSGF
jgi:hypothetical protein